MIGLALVVVDAFIAKRRTIMFRSSQHTGKISMDYVTETYIVRLIGQLIV